MIRLAQLLTVLLALPVFYPSLAAGDRRSGADGDGWRADHHMHLGSPALCERRGCAARSAALTLPDP